MKTKRHIEAINFFKVLINLEIISESKYYFDMNVYKFSMHFDYKEDVNGSI